MHPYLAIDNPGRHVQWQLKRMLAAGPWCWPTDGDPAYARAQQIMEANEPAVGRGVVPLVAVNDYCASLWVLMPDLAWDSRDLGLAELSKSANYAWQTSAAALPRSVRVLWKSVADAASVRPIARHLAALPRPGREVRFDAKLEGRSFGLSFLLSQASTTLDTPIPPDIIASATVDARGGVGPVDGLGPKISVVLERAPQIKRFLVCAAQAEEAQLLAGDPLEIIGIETAAQAVNIAFPDLGRVLCDKGTHPESRSSFIETVFALTLGRHGATHDWKPVAEAAKQALAGWSNLTDGERLRLELAEAIAERHAGNQGQISAPPAKWLAEFPQPIQLAIVTHAVQQSADTGSPDAEAMRALAQQYMVRGADAFDDHLKLLGACGRLEAVTGDPRKALTYQSECTQGWMARFRYGEVSFSLSEELRIAGCLNDAQQMARADAVYSELVRRGELVGLSRSYVDMARCRALVSAGRSGEAIERLCGLHDDESSPVQLQLSAARWLARAHRELKDEAAAETVIGSTARIAQATPRDAAAVEKCYALAALDKAVLAKNSAAAKKAVDALLAAEQHPATHLLLAFDKDLAPSKEAYVQRFYPY